jgi:aminoglycoside phosphotransferase (APT) family kinase protein
MRSAEVNDSSINNHQEDFVAVLKRDGLVLHTDAIVTPLTDGVSSEIYRIDDGTDCFVVKRALPRLKVRDEWMADIGRNRFEQLYIEYVARFLPNAMPSLRPGSKDRGYFAMEFLGAEFTSWKHLLLSGQARVEDASTAASILGTIHARSAGDREAERLFDTTANFTQLRIDPYLLTTGNRHPELRAAFHAEAERLATTRQCLVHGDFSPKNIMVSRERMVLLDCEVAWYGDAAFDVAFLLNHLLLKGLYHAPEQRPLDKLAIAFWDGYILAASRAIDIEALEPRVARLLMMLLLARVDGKSPVEYLQQPEKKDWVRAFTRTGILAGCSSLTAIIHPWFSRLQRWEPLQ